jgi:hypothetical protein
MISTFVAGRSFAAPGDVSLGWSGVSAPFAAVSADHEAAALNQMDFVEGIRVPGLYVIIPESPLGSVGPFVRLLAMR